jgi:prophage regulatory protein
MQILRMKDLQKKTGLSRTTIYERIDAKSKRYDPAFPKPVSLGLAAVGWVEAEVDDWLAARVRESRPQAAA